MDRLQNQPHLLNKTIPWENHDEQLRQENVTLNQKLSQLKKINGNSKLLISQMEWQKSQLNRTKSEIVKYKQMALKIIKQKDSLLKKYETIVHGRELKIEGKTPDLSIIDDLKTDIVDLGKKNKFLIHETKFLKKEIEEMETKIISMEEKEINEAKEFKPHSETRVAVTAEFSNGLGSFLVT